MITLLIILIQNALMELMELKLEITAEIHLVLGQLYGATPQAISLNGTTVIQCLLRQFQPNFISKMQTTN